MWSLCVVSGCCNSPFAAPRLHHAAFMSAPRLTVSVSLRRELMLLGFDLLRRIQTPPSSALPVGSSSPRLRLLWQQSLATISINISFVVLLLAEMAASRDFDQATFLPISIQRCTNSCFLFDYGCCYHGNAASTGFLSHRCACAERQPGSGRR